MTFPYASPPMSTHADPQAARRPRLLVVASTYPAAADDGTPGFVRDIALVEAEEFDTLVLVPRVPGAAREGIPLRLPR